MRRWKPMRWRAVALLAVAHGLFIGLGFTAVPGWIVDLATVGITVDPAYRGRLEGDVRGVLTWAMLAVTCFLVICIGYESRPRQ